MRNDPLLAGPKVYTENGQTYRIKVHGGLNYLRGNRAPHFSITADIDRKGGNGHWYFHSCGCNHDAVVQHFPALAPLVSMHLRDINGEPMHGGANAFYWIVGGQFFPKDRWMDCDKTIEQRIEFVSNELQVSLQDAEAILTKYKTYAISPSQIVEGKAIFMRDEVEPRIETWRENAREIISRFNLKVFGDKWQPEIEDAKTGDFDPVADAEIERVSTGSREGETL